MARPGWFTREFDKWLERSDKKLPPHQQWKPGHAQSFDWCRFRRASRCYFPKQLNEEASRIEGYAVWVPEDRGLCPRASWEMQQTCPVAEPGPKSGDPRRQIDATVPYEEGGQRGGLRGTP